MYGIFTCMCLIFMVNVGKYTIHGSYGILEMSKSVTFIETNLNLSPPLISNMNLSFFLRMWIRCFPHQSKSKTIFLGGEKNHLQPLPYNLYHLERIDDATPTSLGWSWPPCPDSPPSLLPKPLLRGWDHLHARRPGGFFSGSGWGLCFFLIKSGLRNNKNLAAGVLVLEAFYIYIYITY